MCVFVRVRYLDDRPPPLNGTQRRDEAVTPHLPTEKTQRRRLPWQHTRTNTADTPLFGH